MEAVNKASLLARMLSKSNVLVDGKSLSLCEKVPAPSECHSDNALNEQQVVVSKETRNTSNSQNEAITFQLLENVDVSTVTAPEVTEKAPEVFEKVPKKL